MSDQDLQVSVIAELKTVIDPDLHKDIVSLGFVKNMNVEDGKVKFQVELTTPACIEAELGEYLRQPQLKPSFADDTGTEVLAQALTEQAPAIFTNSLALKRWHAVYQQDSLNKKRADEQAPDENQDAGVCKRRATSLASNV